MSPGNRRVFCIYEDEATCQTLTEPLERLGARVTSTSSIGRAFYTAATQQFDLFIIDRSRLDRMGLDVCTKLRQSNPGTPILFFSTPTQDLTAAQAVKAGATQFVVKPDLKALVSLAMKFV